MGLEGLKDKTVGYFEVFTRISDNEKGFISTSPQFRLISGQGETPEDAIQDFATCVVNHCKKLSEPATTLYNKTIKKNYV